MSEPKSQSKSYDIPKRMVWDAWLKVKENGGAAGADGVTIEQYEENLKDNLYKLWNRMSSGSHFPARSGRWRYRRKAGRGFSASRMCLIGWRRPWRLALEPSVEKVFHDDSYGYRPGRSPIDAVGCAVSGAGGRTGSLTWMLEPSSTRCRGT